MRKLTLALTLSLAAGLPGLVAADELTVGTDASVAPVPALPKKGLSSTAVRATYGEPQKKHAPVGGDAPKHPPITRWDYTEFSVFFEHDHVVDAVVPGHPAPVYHVESLKSDRAKP